MEKKEINKWLSDLSQAVGHKLTEKAATKEHLIHLITHLDNIITSLPGCVYWKDTNGIYQGGSNYLAKIAGFESRMDIIGITDYDLPWKSEASVIRKNDLYVMKSKKTLELEESMTLTNGSSLILLTRKAPLRDRHENIIGILGISIDISERKEKENQAEATLNSIVSNMPGHVYWKDREGVYLGSNDRQAESLGLLYGSEIIGKTDFDLPWKTGVADIFRENDVRIMETGRGEIIEERSQVGGRESIVLSQKAPFRNSSGEIIGILGVSIDLTDRIIVQENLENAKTKAEKKADSSQENLGRVIDCMPGSVYWKDTQGVYLGCNDAMAKMIGLPKSEIIGKTDLDFAEIFGSIEVAEAFRRADSKVIDSGVPNLNVEEPPFHFADGKIIHQLSNRVPLLDGENNVVGIIGISIDITDRKKMEKDLHQAKIAAEVANKTKSEFIANMSHDIRTPITGILGLTEELVDLADKTLVSLQQISTNKSNTEVVAKYRSLLNQLIEIVREDGQLVLGSVDELLQLLNEILETMRLESGKAPEREESFDLRELVEHNIEIMQPTARHKKLKLSYEINDQIPVYFSGLRHYLDRTLLNLLSNALKFTDKGFIKINIQILGESPSAYLLGDQIKLKISVQDSGIGIPKDKFETIFEHFSRLTSSYQGIYKGAGLGLYTVKHYVEAMSAKLKVESEVGQGTCFIIILPLTVSDHSDREKVTYRIPRPKAAPIVQTSLSVKEVIETDVMARILIVEDNQIAAKAMQSTITRLYSHCACDRAENGEQAIKMAKENQYDFILMDIGLPDIDGIEVTKQIRALNNSRAKVPIVALTGHGSDWERREEALAAGMQDVYSKPLITSALESLMQNYVFNPEEQLVSPQPTTADTQQDIASIIDWKQCVAQYNGDEACVLELLADLATDLRMSQTKLAKAYRAHDDKTLRDELHRVHGGVVCLTLPQLDKAIAEFHAAVKDTPQNPKHLEKTYLHLQQALSAFGKVLTQFKR